MKVTRALVLALVLGTVGYGWLLLAPGTASGRFGDLVVVPLLLALPVLALQLQQRDAAGVRPWLLPLSTGMALFPLGHLVSAVERSLAPGGAGHLGDLVTMLGYPFLLGGLLAAVAHHLRGLRLTMFLDGLAGALAGGAVAALAVTPLLPSLEGRSWTSVVPLAYPLVDGVLVSAALGGLALVGAGHGRRFGPWVLGSLGLALAHLLEARQVAVGADVGATATVVVVVPALGLMAVGALGHGAVNPSRVPGARSLGVPALASFAAVAVLAAAPAWGVSPGPSLLALSALLVSGVRFLRAFLQLRELAEVREMALTDELTGIANRRALYVHLDALLALDDSNPDSEPDDTGTFAVALIDLDHFKEVNDTLGHATGDALLKGVVGRFSDALAELDTPHLFARLGGDEFAVVLHEATSRNAALIVGQALQESLAEPLDLPGTQLHAAASVGLAVAPVHGRTRSEILFAADAAMYAAKTSGDAVRFHAPARDEKTQQLTLAEDLHRALDGRELCVEYQPIVTGEDELAGVEALVRWDHPDRGLLPPAEFLPAAERYRLTGAVAARVLDVALGDLSRWHTAGATLGVTVNLSAADLRDESIVGVVAEALLAHQLPADVLTLDISETALGGEAADRAAEVVRALDDLGVHLALDDYGTGGTSLTQLHELPFGTIKLGGRFARDAAVDARATGVVRAIVDLAHALGRTIVAEGVEDGRALLRLREVGCDLVQGRYVAAPGPAADVEARLARPPEGRHRLAFPEQQQWGEEPQGAAPASGADPSAATATAIPG